MAGNCIKGGGGCLTQEKIVAFAARQFVIIADSSKKSKHLGDHWKRGIPVEVIPMAYKPLMLKISALGLLPTLRMGQAKAGPVVTDNSNFIIDCCFDRGYDWAALNLDLKLMPGVVETGLFLNMAHYSVFGSDSSTEIVRYH